MKGHDLPQASYVQAYAVPVDAHPAQPIYVEASAPPPPSAPGMAGPPSAPSSAPPHRGLQNIVGHHSFANSGGARELLARNRWPIGLQDAFVRNLSRVPVRYFICDDSGSMSTSDGKRLTEISPGNFKLISCSRWSELTATLKFHSQLALATGAPTEFRLLNGAAPIMIGDGTDGEDIRFEALHAILDGSPGGGTPLCRHIREVTEQIRLIAPGLRAAGQKACVMIATDGESSDGDIASALRPLKDLPAWVVIRLCTDEEKIVNYWNNVDNELELDMDVLDDLCGEAKEVTEHNPWLTYGEPLHRLREFGIPVKEIDLLDETAMTLEQVRVLISLIFGGSVDTYPHPEVDWNGFKLALQAALSRTPQTWCPVKKILRPWVSISGIQALKKDNGSCTIN
jgi:hypothetical protein